MCQQRGNFIILVRKNLTSGDLNINSNFRNCWPHTETGDERLRNGKCYYACAYLQMLLGESGKWMERKDPTCPSKAYKRHTAWPLTMSLPFQKQLAINRWLLNYFINSKENFFVGAFWSFAPMQGGWGEWGKMSARIQLPGFSLAVFDSSFAFWSNNLKASPDGVGDQKQAPGYPQT